jgi:hypothetical protein
MQQSTVSAAATSAIRTGDSLTLTTAIHVPCDLDTRDSRLNIPIPAGKLNPTSSNKPRSRALLSAVRER